jgi:hypothetical protein
MQKLFIGLFVILGIASAATVNTFTDRPTFLAGIGTSVTFDFNQPNGPISTLGSLATISTTGGDSSGQIYTNALCGSTSGSVNCFPPVVFSFLTGGKAFGYENLDFNGEEEAVVTLNFTNGDPAQSFVFDLGGQTPATPIFFGALSDVAISTVEIYSRTPGTTNVGERANVIDNVTLQAAVPEPASLLLIGSGFLLLGVLRRRR